MIEIQDAALAARIEVAAHTVADLDRRLNQVDVAIEETAKRGKTNTALSAMEAQRKARASLADQRQREGVALADLKSKRAALGAKGRQIETEAAPIRYVAELVGADTDSERGDPVANRPHGAVLQPVGHCADSRGFGKEIIYRLIAHEARRSLPNMFACCYMTGPFLEGDGTIGCIVGS